MHTDLAADEGEQSPGVGEIGIEIDGALEHFDGVGEIEFVEAHRAGRRRACKVRRRADGARRGTSVEEDFSMFARRERGEDGVGEIVLQREEVAHVAVNFGRVGGAAFAKFPDLDEHANARAHFLDAAFGDHVYVELAGDLRPLGVALGVLEDGAGGADDEARR